MPDDDIRIVTDSRSLTSGIAALGDEIFDVWPIHFPEPTALDRLRDSDNVHFIAAVADSGVVGFAVLSPQRAEGGGFLRYTLWSELWFVAVAEGSRGKGIATRLHNAALSTALADGRLGLMGWTRPETTGMLRHFGWNISDPGMPLIVPDARTYRRMGIASWRHPVDPAYPITAWRALDPARPVSAFPNWDNIPDDDLARELDRQNSYCLHTDGP